MYLGSIDTFALCMPYQYRCWVTWGICGWSISFRHTYVFSPSLPISPGDLSMKREDFVYDTHDGLGGFFHCRAGRSELSLPGGRRSLCHADSNLFIYLFLTLLHLKFNAKRNSLPTFPCDIELSPGVPNVLLLPSALIVGTQCLATGCYININTKD